MPVTSYPRVTVQGTGAAQNTQNGNALMVLNPSTNLYEAATAATFAGGGGSATAANQTSQIALETSLNALVSTKANQISDAAALANSTNGGVLVDTLTNQVLSVTMTALTTIQACKTVTLINISTNAKMTYCISGGTALSLEAGYSVKLNTNSSGNVQIRQSTGENQTCEIIITA